MAESTMLQPGVQIRPSTTHEDVVDLAKRLYNLDNITLKELVSYDDRNYHIKVTGADIYPDGYVMKITNSLDSKKMSFLEAQNAMMLHLGVHGISCSQPIQNVDGKYCSLEKIYVPGSEDYHEHVVRLLSFEPGTIFCQVPCTKLLSYQAGSYVARMDNVLKEFHHPAYDTRESLWMLKAVPLLRQFLYVVSNPQRHGLVSRVLEAFDLDVVSKMAALEQGIIHGDFNEQNILVRPSATSEAGEWQVAGVIDFGDSQSSCYLFEVAITMCYMMVSAKEDDPLELGGHCLAGYNAVRPLSEVEFKLLKTCISARLCQSVVLGLYSYHQDPGNEYLTTTQEGGWRVLNLLQDAVDADLEAFWRGIIASYHTP